ncbi:hypothetical protein AMEX_G7252 [Astyanax mexicanus]|uniref:Uncharacterized protein n=1 Tax=Astyanax mexicanus TaxID=7994 RepID=A0A8T2M2N5_ASTMX|nr:hypothetical protein AMEX_G7252 [Astyanax mexicanus]
MPSWRLSTSHCCFRHSERRQGKLFKQAKPPCGRTGSGDRGGAGRPWLHKASKMRDCTEEQKSTEDALSVGVPSQ